MSLLLDCFDGSVQAGCINISTTKVCCPRHPVCRFCLTAITLKRQCCGMGCKMDPIVLYNPSARPGRAEIMRQFVPAMPRPSCQWIQVGKWGPTGGGGSRRKGCPLPPMRKGRKHCRTVPCWHRVSAAQLRAALSQR